MNESMNQSGTQYEKEDNLVVGGDKGHEVETLSGKILTLYRAYHWQPISNCTGRYTCRDHDVVSSLTPRELLERAHIEQPFKQFSFDLPGRRDTILIVPLDAEWTTGIISYLKIGNHHDTDGIHTRHVHTLNTPTGFRRKLEALHLSVIDGEPKNIIIGGSA